MLSLKRIGHLGGTTAVVGAVLAACAACCAPLIAPLLAWLGIAGLTQMGPFGLLAAALGSIALGSVLLIRRHRRRQCASSAVAQSSCQAGCKSGGVPAKDDVANSSLPAPIACSLSPTDFKERARWLEELKARALISHRLDTLSAHLSYRIDAADDIEKMVRQERACCSFLHFELRRTADTLELTVTAPADAGVDAHLLFAHLVPH